MVTSQNGEFGLHAARLVKTELSTVIGTVPIPLLSSEEETAWDLGTTLKTAMLDHVQVIIVIIYSAQLSIKILTL